MAFAGDELTAMYQDVILEAARQRSGSAHFAPDLTREGAGEGAGEATFTASHEYCTPGQSHQFNPTCGDEVTVRVELTDGSDGPRRVESLVWDGHGCSISQASLSIMHDLVEGRSVEEAMHLFDVFRRLMESRGKGLDSEDEMDELDDACAFQGVSRFPMRIKCALLGWEGMRAAVAQALAADGSDASTGAAEK